MIVTHRFQYYLTKHIVKIIFDLFCRNSELSNSSEVILSSTPFNTNQRSSEDMADGLEDLDDRLIIDPHNVESSFAFHDAKRKLRMMLSEADMALPATSIGKNLQFYANLSAQYWAKTNTIFS